MGARVSRTRLPEDVRAHLPTFELIGLKEHDVRRLYGVFHKVDLDGSGELSLMELLEHLKLEKTEFSRRVFSIFDEDKSGEVDFREFVLAMWNYCTLTKASLIIFAFDLYDYDDSSTMEVSEMIELCKDVYGASFKRNRLACQILEKIDKMNSTLGKEVSVDRFAAFCESHPGLLYPAFSFQRALQRKVLGPSFWASVAKQRVTLPSGVQIKIQDVLSSHVDERKFHGIAKQEREHVEQHGARDTRGGPRFEDLYQTSGSVNERRTVTQKSWGRANRKIQAASALASIAASKKNATSGAPGAAGSASESALSPEFREKFKKAGLDVANGARPSRNSQSKRASLQRAASSRTAALEEATRRGSTAPHRAQSRASHRKTYAATRKSQDGRHVMKRNSTKN